MNTDYPEIQALKNFTERYVLETEILPEIFIHKDLTTINLRLNNKNYHLQIEDEYNDLKLCNKLVNAVLVLRELEALEDSTDYLDWCRELGLNAGNEPLRNYYQDTVKHLPEISRLFPDGKIRSFISYLDFQLNSGAMQALRRG
ncbi:hypothetical protein GWK08_09105 [Leptobacterium flavescens]|uniref:Uncharacterized protein n=1 Tax=Leptobacterium flavescens TaxID=472055 RepID=A0A6P0URU8_9FLAO|nr:hypothetical protein [Leptobacterium flavescens]NER13593.1 hypothetical protein [Leptobacterium flavescens]